MAEKEEAETQSKGEARTPEETQKRRAVFIAIFLLALVLVGFYGYYWAKSPKGQRTLEEAWQFIKKNNPITWYWQLLEKAPSIGENVWTSKVNASSLEKGLKFNNFKPIGTAEFPQGSPISFEYDLELANIEVENLPLTIHCSLGKGDIQKLLKSGVSYHTGVGVEGIKILPPTEDNKITISGSRIYEDIRCIVSGDITKELEGTVTFVGSVSFPFKTKDVTLPVYFTTKSVARSLGKEDFFEHFKIDESQPIRAVYNGEPIEIGIGVSTDNEQPVVVGEGRHPLIGVTLKNEWDGYMPELLDLRLEVPRELVLNKDLSQSPNEICPFELSRTGTKVNEYKIAERIRQNVKLKSDGLRTFECWFDVVEDIVESGAFYSKKFYRVNADYNYHLENKTSTVTVKKLKTEGALEKAEVHVT